MVVCPGGQSALTTAFRALAAPGETILVEAPTYLGALAAARAAGLRVCRCRERRRRRAARPPRRRAAPHRRAAVLLPAAVRQPARAPSLAADRRAAVLDAVTAAGAFLRRGRLGARPRDRRRPAAAARRRRPRRPRRLPALADEVRRARACGSPRSARAARPARGCARCGVVDDLFVSGPLQEAALDLVSSPAWRRHLRRLRAALRERRDALAAALDRRLPELRVAGRPAGGLHLWAALPEDVDDVALAAAAAAAAASSSTPAGPGSRPSRPRRSCA